jgi:hypothetical protein
MVGQFWGRGKVWELIWQITVNCFSGQDTSPSHQIG